MATIQRTVRPWTLRILLVAAALALGALIAGCSGTDDDDDSENDSAGSAAAQLEAVTRALAAAEQTGSVPGGGIHAHGAGIATGDPDIVVFSLAAQARGQTVTAARDDTARAMDGILGALRDAGIADADIETARFSVQPRYDYSRDSGPMLIGYEVTNTLSVTVRNIDSLPTIIDNAITGGGDAIRIDDVRYEIEDAGALELQARRLAVQDAIAKADFYAEQTGVTRGKLTSIVETSRSVPFYQPNDFLRAENAFAAPTQLFAPELEVRVDVQAVFRIE